MRIAAMKALAALLVLMIATIVLSSTPASASVVGGPEARPVLVAGPAAPAGAATRPDGR